MRELVLSTDNINKLREIREILQDLDVKIYGKSDIEGLDFEVIEDGDTLYDNALKKASAIADRVNYAVLADDTGLFVKSLNGEPGVHSARYASEHDDKKNREKLLDNLKDKDDRSAYFKTQIILIDEDKNIIPIEGICSGKISLEEKGDNGFGYDSIFIPEGFDKTFAEMSHEEKNKISHRARALKNLRDKLLIL
ncbi:RdgB/HAM1 family non-canonical purine NTP pyrophosphatase [Peptoniphilus sp. SGI.035]|uniref:RdgB/HAM1 family non-canonical purine NTP pyrophosphatase n=1 Tax=unclassified Peptoniphilus TaxID=2637196 RepID=UPI0025DC5502|nr:RdgB/HAM1 family non-canonical purine NTP pyrophosphatase [Peptoniphilus sp.]MCI5643373.1 RdgB/HAM1 family non-canonical purine NTP pyrophosphatase [Peptoniphilus sp.]MDD7353384.1 RdgB/HAM1 family non-canonical purine NTP pyrophosphatase [Peptoniphilaceae bacterium]